MEQKQVMKVQKKSKSLKIELNKTRKRNSNLPLTVQEVEKLISETTDLRDKTMFILGFNTGMRVSEISQLEPARINYEEQVITIWDSKKDKYRMVYASMNILNFLKTYWNSKQDKKTPLFFDYHAKTIERRIQYWSEEVLAKRKSWHAVRHTYVSLSAELGRPISIVIQNTGDSPRTILAVYDNPTSSFIRSQLNEKELYKIV